MSDQFENVDLTSHTLDICYVLDAAFFKNFDCNMLVCQLVHPFTNFAKSALANFFFNIIVTDDSFLLLLNRFHITFFTGLSVFF